MQLSQEDKDIVVQKISENLLIVDKMKLFEENFRKSKSFIFGIGADKQLYKIGQHCSYESLLMVEEKNISKMLFLGAVIFVVVLIFLMAIGFSANGSFISSALLTAFIILGSKTMSDSLDSRRIFRENIEIIGEFYYCQDKLMENLEFIGYKIRGGIVDYAETQPMVSVDDIKNNGFDFLPDNYIYGIMDEEVEKGKYERIEVSNLHNHSNKPKYLYKSKSPNHSITSIALDIS